MAFFEDQLEAADTSEIKILEMLVSIQAYTHYTKVRIQRYGFMFRNADESVETTTDMFSISKLNDHLLEWCCGPSNHT